MKIRKYEGENETEAMLKVKEELGREALIVSVKNIRPKGLFRLFKKPYVEVTAALDDHSVLDDGDKEPTIPRKPVVQDKELTMAVSAEEDESVYLERFKTFVQNLPEPGGKFTHKEQRGTAAESESQEEIREEVEVANAALIKAVYDQLLENEVNER